MSPLRGLYAITSGNQCRDAERLRADATATLRAGCRLLQYRDKQNPPERREAQARELLELCRRHGVPLVINDDLDLAVRIGAGGVHLGANDADPAVARARLGPEALIGASCGNDLERARKAAARGASYVAFGRFFPSRTKPDAPPAELDTLRAARSLGLTICAIGGLTPANAAAVIDAGADLIAAVDGVFGSGDVEAATRRYVNLFK